MSGPKAGMKASWALIQQHLTIDDPTPPGLFLGCSHEQIDMKINGKKVRGWCWNMESQVKKAVDLYTELTGRTLKKVTTPFRSLTSKKGTIAAPITDGPWLRCPWCKGEYDEKCFERGTGDPAKADAKRKAAAKKLLDPEDITQANPRFTHLSELAMRVIMTLLYSARIARNDLLRAINALGSRIHTWDEECEEDLFRLMCYCNSSLDKRQYAWVGDHVSELSPHRLC